MFKINYYSLFFLGFLFINAPNVHCFSSSQPNNSSLPPTPSQQRLFPNIFQQAGNGDSTVPLFPISSSVMPQPYNWHFNSSTHTFIPPLMLSGWGYNMSTDTFNINSFSLPIAHENGNCNDAFANTNNRASSLIPNKSISSNTTDTAADKNNNFTPPVAPHTQWQKVSHTKQDKNHGLSESNKKEKRTKIYTYPTCHKSLGSKNTFNYHVKSHHPNRERPFQCNICNTRFAEKHILKNHIKRHKNEKPFKCEFCSKSFKTKYKRIAHHRTHTGEKPFMCDICGKGLSSKNSLKDHLNMHRGKKPYSCEECEKSFRKKSSLKEHRNLHKNEKPYTCGQCTKAYTSKNGLRYHLRMHNMSKPYTCHYCDAAFAHKSEYENHIRYEEEPDDDRKCHICQKVYSDKYHLKYHNKRAHSKT